jgi:transketolase
MARSGYFPVEELATLRKLGSRLQGHPHRLSLPGLEISSGSLGQGLSVAVGMALGFKIDNRPQRVYCLMGDGECNEGQIWEAAMTGAHYRLDNLCGIVDVNGLQIDGRTEDVMNLEPLAHKWEAFGWHAMEIDGHSFEELLKAFDIAKKIRGKPVVILANTVKGKGVSFMEHKAEWHGKAPSKEQAEEALKCIGECV